MRAFLIPALFGLTAFAEQLVAREFPHLIIPLNSWVPDIAPNTQKAFSVQPEVWTETSFDVPWNQATYCRFGFSLDHTPTPNPVWVQWAASDYVINIAELDNDSINRDNDTWNNHPAPRRNVATLAVNKTGYATFLWQAPIACQWGQVAQFLLQPANLSESGGLWWYELDTPLNGLTYDMYVAGEE